nr:hypothetical protein [Vibrio cidicii]
MSGFISALAGVILAARMTSGQPMTSVGFELVVISACVLGGVSLKGGIGKVSYVVAGVLILGTVENAMNLLNMSPFRSIRSTRYHFARSGHFRPLQTEKAVIFT